MFYGDLKRSRGLPRRWGAWVETLATPALWTEHAQAATLSQSVSLLQGLKDPLPIAIDP